MKSKWETDLVKVLFVCTGNICRSPTAEGVFRKLVIDAGVSDKIFVDSAGTGAWHVDQAPDRRSQEAARKRGIDLSAQRARQVTTDDFKNFDYVLAMDAANLRILSELCPSDLVSSISLFLDYAPSLKWREVPDPYHGGGRGFEVVLDLIEAASNGLLSHIRSYDL